ncbi:Monothiol glutaredoxin-4, partial [Tolypocladium ophioglossoides CBS 100239]
KWNWPLLPQTTSAPPKFNPACDPIPFHPDQTSRPHRTCLHVLQPTMSTITEITSSAQWEQLLASVPASTLLVVSFHAPWAAPCAQMTTVLSTLASEYPVTEPPSTAWVSINAEELSEVSEAYDVTAVPFLVLLRNSQVIETVSGSSAVKVRTAIETHARSDGKAPSTTGATNGIEHTGSQPNEDQSNVDPEKQKEELFKRLEDLVKAAPVMLFMKGTPSSPKCGFSRQMVAILRENSVKYGFFNILADDEVRQGLKEYAEWPTYPQLWMDGELVGGLDIVKEELGNSEDFFKPYSVSGSADAAAASHAQLAQNGTAELRRPTEPRRPVGIGPNRYGLQADYKASSPANAIVGRTWAGASCRDTDEEMTEFAMQNHIKIVGL